MSPVTSQTQPPRVVVVGSVNVDLVVRLSRLPGPGETATGGRFLQAPGGKGANQAAAAARLGADTTLIARVGDDPFGHDAIGDLAAAGVDTKHVSTTSGEATGVAVILVDATGENLIGVASGANHALTADDVRRAFTALPQEFAVVVACLEVPVGAVEAAALCAHERHWPFVLNPAPAAPLPQTLLEHTAVLTPNAHEADQLGAGDPRELLRAGVGAVVITRGADGADILTDTDAATHVPAYPTLSVDTTGAGDTFTGALAWALARGDDLPTAVVTANAAAALSTQGLGARGALPTADDVLQLLSPTAPGHGIPADATDLQETS